MFEVRFWEKKQNKKNPSKNALTTRWSPPPNKQVKKWNEKDTVISKLVQRASHSSSHLSIVLLTGLDIWKGMISTSSFSSLQHFFSVLRPFAVRGRRRCLLADKLFDF